MPPPPENFAGSVLISQCCIPLTRKHFSGDLSFPRYMFTNPNFWLTIFTLGRKVMLEVGGSDIRKIAFMGSVLGEYECCNHDPSYIDSDSVSSKAEFDVEPDFTWDYPIDVSNSNGGKIGTVKSRSPDTVIHVTAFLRKDVANEELSLSSDMRKLMGSGVACDVELHFEEPNNANCKKAKLDSPLKTHKAILCARSPYFLGLFNSDMTEAQDNRVSVKFPRSVMEAFLSYVYTGHVDNMQGIEKEVLKAADYYGLPALKVKCEDHLLQYLEPSNAVEFVILGDKYGAGKLKEDAIGSIVKNLKEVRSSHEWKNFLHNHPDLGDEVMGALQDYKTTGFVDAVDDSTGS